VFLSFKEFGFSTLPGYGVWARVNSSHKTTPKDQTSDCVENVRSLIDSSAIHLIGRGPLRKIPFFINYKIILAAANQ
jgi:hypothetical protein